MPYKITLSIVVPLYNEKENVVPLVETIQNALTDYSYEIILVDDYSTDQTVQVAKEFNHPKVHLIELKKNYGQSAALAAGIEYAHGEYIVTMDGDLQNDPSDIPVMLEKLKNGNFDIIAGIRANRKDNKYRVFPSKVANYIIRKSVGIDLKDNGCALKVFKSETAKEIKLYGEMHRFITLLGFLEGARVTQMDVKHHARQFGESKYGFERIFKVISDLLLILFMKKYFHRPIHLFGNMGLFLFFTGVLINCYLLIEKILGHDIGGRPLLLLGVLFLLAGIQLFTIGLVSELVMRTYFESQNKKPYRIREITSYE